MRDLGGLQVPWSLTRECVEAPLRHAESPARHVSKLQLSDVDVNDMLLKGLHAVSFGVLHSFVCLCAVCVVFWYSYSIAALRPAIRCYRKVPRIIKNQNGNSIVGASLNSSMR